MSPLEAMTHLLALGDKELKFFQEAGALEGAEEEYRDQLAVSIAVIQAMLNTAMPVARFRAHVTVDKVSKNGRLFKQDFTVCGVTMGAIRNGLVGLSTEATDVEVTVWEQKPTGADMISGYRGWSKAPNYRTFLASLFDLETMPTVQ